jgi:hypothetical protein
VTLANERVPVYAAISQQGDLKNLIFCVIGLQPIWFQHTGKEFPEVEEFVQRTSADYLTYRGGLKTPDGDDVNRMWVVQANTSKEFNEAMAQVIQFNSIQFHSAQIVDR